MTLPYGLKTLPTEVAVAHPQRRLPRVHMEPCPLSEIPFDEGEVERSRRH